jgi:hypothetical protein
MPIATQVAVAQIVAQNHDEVRPLRFFGASRERHSVAGRKRHQTDHGKRPRAGPKP